jgi:hypothetical protein
MYVGATTQTHANENQKAKCPARGGPKVNDGTKQEDGALPQLDFLK